MPFRQSAQRARPVDREHGGRPARRPGAPVNPFPFDAGQREIDPHSTPCAAGRGDGSNESVRGQIRRMTTFRRQRYRVQPHWIPDISDIVSDPNEAGSNVTLDYDISEIGSNEAGSDIVESDTTSTTITGSNEAGSDMMTLDPTRFGSNIAPAPNGIGSDVCRYRIQPHRIRYWRIIGPRPDPTNRRHWIRGGFRSDDRPLRKLSLPTGAGRKMGAEHCCVYGDPHSPGRDNASALAGRRRDGQVGHRECKSSTRRGGFAALA